MSSSDEQLASNLLEIIEVKLIERICVYEHGSSHCFEKGVGWHFGPKTIQLGQFFYNTITILTYKVTGKQLALYF